MPPTTSSRNRSSGQSASRSTAARKATTSSASGNAARSSSAQNTAKRGAHGASKAAAKPEHGAIHLQLPLIGHVHLPPPQHLAFYAGVGLLAAAELIEWPVAILVGVGKALADNRSHANLEEFGEALESA